MAKFEHILLQMKAALSLFPPPHFLVPDTTALVTTELLQLN